MIKLEEYAIYSKEIALIQPLTLHIPKGEFFAVIGESGGGKTLLSKAIIDLLPKELTERGKINRSKEPADLIVQQPLDSLQPNLSIRRQFHQFLKSQGVKERAVREQKMDELLTEVGFSQPLDILSKKTYELSGGMCQRVTIAMVMFSVPKLLIADEPTSALDAQSKELVLRLLYKIYHEHEMTIIFITHDLSIVHRFSTFVAVMKAGKLVETGPTKAVLTSPQMPYTKELMKLFEEKNSCINNR